MPVANCVLPSCGIARHHVGVDISKLPTRKADLIWKNAMWFSPIVRILWRLILPKLQLTLQKVQKLQKTE